MKGTSFKMPRGQSGDNIDRSQGYRSLANAIILVAIRDYRRSAKRNIKYDKLQLDHAALGKWLRSSYCQRIAGDLDMQAIMDRVDKELQAERRSNGRSDEHLFLC